MNVVHAQADVVGVNGGMIKLEIKFIFKTVNNRDWWNNRVDTDADEHSHLKRSRFVPYFGLTYDLNENNSLYLSYTSIFNTK
ncbi:hypothetical protein KZ322_01735 [Glaesserella parasuis]|nr:hypothetical protein [Glaesserella parasuis]MCT8655247.1 hypothetical protein [Glaesserella parasuis]MCT8758039.1 hypothetical protein [Glaesserella parasuis]MDG6310537.1 hypothetical protein [Glaesserella parasuis]MDO9731369.1 hypothetical protein [Glaesserella parasuis]